MCIIEAASVNIAALYDTPNLIPPWHIPNILSYKLHSTPDSIVGEFFKNDSALTPSDFNAISTYWPF